MIKINKAERNGTRSNSLKLFINNELAGSMDIDHRRIKLIKEFAAIDEEELINALADYDCDANMIDRTDAFDEYCSYSIIFEEEDEEEY